MSKFVHLHTHSHYSLLDGLSQIDPLIERTKKTGMTSIALTDHGNLYGAVEFYKKARKAGIKPILGVEAYMAPKSRFDRESRGEKYYHLILLCENVQGWKNLIKLVSLANIEGYYYKPRMDKELLRQYHEGLIASSACLGGEIDQLLLAGKFAEAKEAALEYQDIFGKGNYFLEIQKHPHIPDSEKIEDEILRLSAETGIPLVGTQDSHYICHEDAEYHDVLLAVQTGNKLTDDDRLSLKADDFSIGSPEEMLAKFERFPGASENTVKIADRCNVELELGKTLLPDFPKPEGKSANEYLRDLVMERLPLRFADDALTSEVKERLEYEMGVIEKTGFADYFLIVQDLIMWAKTHGIAVGPGRGSAAGSLVSYILQITDVNPLAYDLLFERFLNPDRIQMPDIDIDFADARRDEVLAYARAKYGEDRVAQIITFGTMAARAAVRDAGRAMGLSYSFCDQIAKLIPQPIPKDGGLKEAIEMVPELQSMYDTHADARKLLDTAQHLEGVVRHASVHACGTVIAKDPLTDRCPIQLAPQDKNIIITQFEMHAVEDIGLLKIDFLGLRNLTIIEHTLRLVRELHGQEIVMSKVPLEDKETYKLLQNGDTTGVFQFESAGMRRYMREIKPTVFEDLIALVALYRPGPMDNIPTFIARKHGKEKISYLHPKLEPILRNTYGIGVYQEQMMRIARDLAGFTLAEADTLRKAIGKKIVELLDQQKEKLIVGMKGNGIAEQTARAIWELFPPFARYGFNKSHAACYALIGYWTAYLKAHYREEFMAALLNAELNDIERTAFLIGEAKQANLEVLPPDINTSFVYFTPEGPKIRFGLLGIKNVGEDITRAIIDERARGGPFRDFVDFLSRVQHQGVNKKSLESLAKAGVFDSMGLDRNLLLSNMEEIVRFAASVRKVAETSKRSLFGDSYVPAASSLKLAPAEPPTTQQKLAWEKELLGFYLSDHPLNAWKDKIKEHNIPSIATVMQIKDENKIFRLVGLVSTVKKILTKSNQQMAFVTIEDLSGTIELIIFQSVYAATADVWKETNLVLVQGKMNWRNGEGKFMVDKAKILGS